MTGCHKPEQQQRKIARTATLLTAIVLPKLEQPHSRLEAVVRNQAVWNMRALPLSRRAGHQTMTAAGMSLKCRRQQSWRKPVSKRINRCLAAAAAAELTQCSGLRKAAIHS